MIKLFNLNLSSNVNVGRQNSEEHLLYYFDFHMNEYRALSKTLDTFGIDRPAKPKRTTEVATRQLALKRPHA